MEVTKHTFNEQLERIIEDINESDFIAIDGEFTGLDATNSGHTSPFDTPEERYSKITQECSDFLLIQFGLCTFKVDEEKQRYEAKPYNFYVFPTPLSRHSPDRRFLCQSSSIDFLASQGFDFNKLFKEGIPYLIPEEENKLRADLERRHEEINKDGSGSFSPHGRASVNKSYVPIPEEQKTFINNISEQITQYLDDEDAEPLVIPPCNAFQRKLIYQTVEKKFPLVHLETKTGDDRLRYMEVSRAKSAQEQRKYQMDMQNLQKMELDIQVGFTKVIRAITASGKLVVGHNMFLDVFHILNNFHGNLPSDVDDFKTVAKSVLPRLVDTKLMASTQPLQEHISYSGLNGMMQTLSCEPFQPAKVDIAADFERYHNGGGAMHEAGYDALVTGRCFLTMINYLGSLQNPPASFTLPSSSIVEPFVNKLFLMRIIDIPYLNLNGPDLKVNRDHVFHVTFPKEWKPSDLYALFKPYGNIQISWLTSTTAYVALYLKENSALALKALSQPVISSFHVTSYAAHQLSKSLHLSSTTLSATSSPNKRKLVHGDDEDSVIRKVKRHTLSEQVCPVDAVENSILADGNKSENTHGNHHSPESMTEDSTEKTTDKLFDESDTW
uniref:Poly(A)-specific ribonuclease PARN n=1 Tax=Arion vulgaris TaxID=1028688 RepID=A0A0B6ZFZ7_9EUPU